MICGVEPARCWICETEENVALHEFTENGIAGKAEQADLSQFLLCDGCAENIHKKQAESE